MNCSELIQDKPPGYRELIKEIEDDMDLEMRAFNNAMRDVRQRAAP